VAATLEELEARVAALEAGQADYRAVLAAINALAANQREHAEGIDSLRRGQDELRRGQDELRRGQDETNARMRSLEENHAEVKDLLIRALDR